VKGRKPSTITPGSHLLKTTPKVPAWLSKEAKSEWRRVAPILVSRGNLTLADLGTLENYWTAVGLVREAQRFLNAAGIMLGRNRHPAVGIQNTAMATATRCGGELGLTPYSRSRSPVRDLPSEDDGLTDLDL
jgi:P27 family predicted phage terminase small subunit